MQTYPSIEHNIWDAQLGPKVYTIISIYHPPQSIDQQFKNSKVIDQFTDLLTEELPKHQDLIIMGDISIHINNNEDQDAQTLLNTLEAFNLKQHVNIPTHNLGHTLDLIITPATYQGSLIVGPYISDHRFITLETLHIKPKPKLEKRTLRKFTNDTALQFINEFNNIPILESTTLDMATKQPNNEMLKTIKKIALATTQTITSRHKNHGMMKT